MDGIGQNSWVIEPKDDEKFYPSKIKKILQEILDDRMKNETYDPNTTPVLAEDLVKKIRSKIRESHKMPRFKIAVQVFIGENQRQGCKITSKSLWDPTWDNYASYAFSNEKIYAVAMAFGVYYE